uniref:PKD domain-containing protein n=1 Tax=Lutibacter sp. TaxID=1925666 RepID=UPI003564E9A3
MKTNQVFRITLKNGIRSFIVFLFLFTIISNSQIVSIASAVKNYFAAISATVSVDNNEVCQNGAKPVITFKGEGGAGGPYTFTYKINGGTEQTIKTNNTDDSINISVNTSGSGDFNYELIKVEDSNGDIQTISGQIETIKINKLPIVDFSFTNDNSCSGTLIQFTTIASGNGPFKYLWDFGDTKSSTNINPNHIYNSYGCGSKIFNIILTVTDANNCSTTIKKVINVKQLPDIDFYDDDLKDFNNCGNALPSDPSYTINVGNNSISAACISSYDIDWGDGNFSNGVMTFPIAHTYLTLGVFKMKITAIGNDGCNNIKTYDVKNVSNPGGGFVSPGSTQNLCAPTKLLEFEISNWGVNSLDTSYDIDYGDGNTLKLTQVELNNSIYYNSLDPASSQNYPIPHSYVSSSCAENNGKFLAKLTISNACDSTDFTISNISILAKSEANFTNPIVSCVNSSVNFENTTIVGDNTGCSKNALFTWDFGDGTIETNLSSTANNVNHIYTLEGNYTITLTVKSNCGESTTSKQICIEPPLAPQFLVDNAEGCIPFNISISNTTDLAGSCSPPIYLWAVTYTASNCGTAENWDFTNGTDENSKEPEFVFNEAGIYTLTLATTNSCGTKISAPQVIIVKRPPKATIEPIADFCGPTVISPVALIENCTTDISGLTYNWTFIGGTPTSSNQLNPGAIDYTLPGLYTITLEVTNECGVSNKATEIFEILPIPTITNTDLTQNICSGIATTEIFLTSDNPNTTYTWTSIATAGITGFIPSGTASTIPAQTITNTAATTGTVTYTITPSIGTCVGPSVDYVITVDPAANITSQPESSVVCLGAVANQLTVSYVGPNTPVYQWYENGIDSNTGGTPVTGATSVTYDPPINVLGTIYYYVTITFPAGSCSEVVSATATVTVEPGITIDPPRPLESICVDGTVSTMDVTYTGGTGTPTYQWYVNTTD